MWARLPTTGQMVVVCPSRTRVILTIRLHSSQSQETGAQLIGALVALSEGVGSVPCTHMLARCPLCVQFQASNFLFWCLWGQQAHVSSHMYMHPNTWKEKKYNFKWRQRLHMPSVMAHTFNPGTQETEAGGPLWVRGQTSLHCEFQDNQRHTVRLSQKQLKKKTKQNKTKKKTT